MTARKGPRGGDTNAAGILRYREYTPTLAQIQDAAIESASEVREIEERCLSAIYRGLPGSYDLTIDAGLTDAAMFAFPEHTIIYRVLISAGIIFRNKPSIGVIRAALADEFDLHFEHRVGWAGEWDELAEILLCECSASGLRNYAASLIDFARRRALYHLLITSAEDVFDRFKPIEDISKTVAETIESWRVDGVDLPKPPRLRRLKMPHPRLRGRVIK